MKTELTRENLIQELETATSLRQLITNLGYSVGGANAKMIKAKLTEYGLSLTGISEPRKFFTLEEILVVDSPYQSTRHLKEKLVKLGILENLCVSCGNAGTWLDKPIALQLDHINGIPTDNSLENLRILCPNCHTQTETWGGKNVKS